jgi:hypothetical protein
MQSTSDFLFHTLGNDLINYQRHRQEEPTHTLILTVKVQKLANFYFQKFRPKFGIKSKKSILGYSISNQRGQK